MKRSKLLYLSWLLAIVILIAIITTHRSNTTTFYGLAETREIIINSEHPVEIKEIHVVPGQIVKKGELLVELARPELTMEINLISHQIDELRTEEEAVIHELRTRIRTLEAEKASVIGEINSQIKELEARYDMNRELTSDLKSLAQTDESRGTGVNHSPIEIQVENLKAALAVSGEPMQAEINMIEQSLRSTKSPLKIQAESLEKQLSLLLEEKNKLSISAQVSGVIGSVNVIRGREQTRYLAGGLVVPFSPILTLHTGAPSYIRGFINEKAHGRITAGRKTRVVSLADPGNSIIGKVISVGSRIIEFPIRLWDVADVPVWGREVLIRIREDNRFLLGEKVLIRMCDGCEEEDSVTSALPAESPSGGNTSAAALGDVSQVPADAYSPTDIRIDKSLGDVSPVEVSGDRGSSQPSQFLKLRGI